MANKLPEKSKRRSIKGVVIGNGMNKTVKVLVVNQVAHPRYKKIVERRKVYFAHIDNEIDLDAEVLIEESKPYSKNVRWKVTQVFNKEK